jgi:hypothetical protein
MARKQQGKSDDELSKELEKLDAKVNSFCLINFSQLINGCAGGGAFTTHLCSAGAKLAPYCAGYLVREVVERPLQRVS